MPKLKSHKAITKRIKITKTGKFLSRTGGQDRYNAKERSKTRLNKQKDREVSKKIQKTIKRLMPYSV